MQGETLEDVQKWLEVGIKAWFPFDPDTIAALRAGIRHLNGCRGGSSTDKRALKEQLETQAQRLENRLALFKIKIDGEYVSLDAFTISACQMVGEQQPTPDGSMDNTLIDGWLVECAVPIRGTRDTPPDVDIAEVGKFPSAMQAAIKVIELLMRDHVANAYQSQAEADAHEQRKREAEEVF